MNQPFAQLTLFALLLGIPSAGCTATAAASPAPEPPGCAPDSTVQGCAGNAGYSCGNSETPEQADSSLVCSDGITGSNGLELFCCVTFRSSSCAPDSTVQGCPGSSIGFSCTGSDSPDQADSSLSCGPGTPGNAGSLLYCCAV
ncbi:MAG TPA: hypothetical protein VKU41_25300 [Polyangiaceae bacterium]|nr:hypothetical protein [Polyangiaceae bacterium]